MSNTRPELSPVMSPPKIGNSVRVMPVVRLAPEGASCSRQVMNRRAAAAVEPAVAESQHLAHVIGERSDGCTGEVAVAECDIAAVDILQLLTRSDHDLPLLS